MLSYGIYESFLFCFSAFVLMGKEKGPSLCFNCQWKWSRIKSVYIMDMNNEANQPVKEKSNWSYYFILFIPHFFLASRIQSIFNMNNAYLIEMVKKWGYRLVLCMWDVRKMSYLIW